MIKYDTFSGICVGGWNLNIRLLTLIHINILSFKVVYKFLINFYFYHVDQIVFHLVRPTVEKNSS